MASRHPHPPLLFLRPRAPLRRGWPPVAGALLTASLCCLAQCSTTRPDAPDFVASVLEARPASELSDIYKLLYQGAFGTGHMISSRAAAGDYLRREMETMGDAPRDPLLEPCSADGRMVRVNLRPFARAPLDTGRLLDAIMETVERVAPDTASFLAAWTAVGAAIRRGTLPFDAGAYDAFSVAVRGEGYPAVHHSDAYREAYHPAYRVVLRDAFTRRFPDLMKEQ
jgi:hypothetical protein